MEPLQLITVISVKYLLVMVVYPLFILFKSNSRIYHSEDMFGRQERVMEWNMYSKA